MRSQKKKQQAPSSIEVLLARLVKDQAITRAEAGELREASFRESQERIALAVENTASTEREEKERLRTIVGEISRYYERLVGELQEQVHRDPDTGLYNLPFLHAELERELALPDLGRVSGLAKIDIRKFKFYNDHEGLGHHVGDEVIKAVAKQLERSTRQGRSEKPDLCVRRGGDEFILFMQDLHNPTEGYTVTQRFKEAVRDVDFTQSIRPEEAAIIATQQPVEVDIGLAFLLLAKKPLEFETRKSSAGKIAQEWIIAADMMMYEAKRLKSKRVEPIGLSIDPDKLDGQFLEPAEVNLTDV